MRKKSPAQGGPARGSSAPGLGGKNERAEPSKHGGPCLVPLRPSFFLKISGSRICSGRTNFYPQGGTISRSCRAISEKIIPGLEGGTNWFPPAYDPSSGVLFVATNQ
jgi:hypothetical protein